jgi:hypothetical protein
MPEDRSKGLSGQTVNASRTKQTQGSLDHAEGGDHAQSDQAVAGKLGLSPAGGSEQPKNDRRKRGDLQKRQ